VSFSAYIIMLGGICAVMVLIELILPESSTSKYIRSIASIFVVFAIIAPVPSMIKNVQTNIGSNGNLILDEAFLQDIAEEKRKLIENNIKSNLKLKEIEVDLTLSMIITEGEMKIVYASVMVNSYMGEQDEVVDCIKNIIKKYVNLSDDNINVIMGDKNG